MSPFGSEGTFGVTRRLAGIDPIDEAICELRINGFALIDSGLPPGVVADLGERIDRAYSLQKEEMGGEAMYDPDIARCMLAYDLAFLPVASAPPLIELARRVLGPEFILMMQNGIINRPHIGNQQAKWHRDLNYQHWTSSQPLAINALLCVDPFSRSNGATYVLPGTHLISEFPTTAFAEKHAVQVEAPAGAFIVLDAMLFHKGGFNQTTEARRAVNHVIGLPFMAQQIDIPSACAKRGVEMPADPQLRKYLGERWSPAADVFEWRRRRSSTKP